MQPSQFVSKPEYFYINSPDAFLHNDVNSGNLVGRVFLGETAEITKAGGVGRGIRGLTQFIRWFEVHTPDGRKGYLSEGDVIIRDTPYCPNLEVRYPNVTIYSTYYHEDKVTFQPNLIVYEKSRLQGLRQLPVAPGQDFFWIEVALPDGNTRYIKSTKVVLEEGALK